jgi:glutamine phosphoribosylpyrophosphate amidotransferase
VRYYTGNDSEIIGVYLADRMARGDAFEDALQASVRDLDGSFCYVAATADALGYAKDPFGLKPLMVADTELLVAIATEEIAIRRALGTGFPALEPGARRTHTWRLPAMVQA